MNFIAKNRSEVFALRRNKHTLNRKYQVRYFVSLSDISIVNFWDIGFFLPFLSENRIKIKRIKIFTKQIFFVVDLGESKLFVIKIVLISIGAIAFRYQINTIDVYHLIIKSVLIQYTRANGNYLNMSIFTSKRLALFWTFFRCKNEISVDERASSTPSKVIN